MNSRAQQIIERLDSHLDEYVPGVEAAAAMTVLGAREITKHRTRSKYGLHADINQHFSKMQDIKKNGKAGIDKRQAYRALRDKTIDTMATKVHKLRSKHGLSTNQSKEHRIARRAFHGTLTGAPSIIMPNTPEL